MWFGLFSIDNVSSGDVILDSIEPVRVDEGVEVLGIEVYSPDQRTPAGLIDGDCGTPGGLTTHEVAGYRLAPGRTAGVVVRLVPPKIAGERGLTGLRVRYRTAPNGPVFRQTFDYRAAGHHRDTGPPCGQR